MHLFVVGTDTGVGKTVASVALALKYKRPYWKPVQSGTREKTDSEWAAEILGPNQVLPEAYRLSEPLSPHLSSRLDGVVISLKNIKDILGTFSESLIIEGCGGLLVPMNEEEFLMDLVTQIQCEVVLVARSALGTINHTLLSLEALRSRGIEPMGIIMNGPLNPENLQAVEVYGKAKVMGVIPQVELLDRQQLARMADEIYPGGPNGH